MREKMPLIYQHRQSELEQLLIEAHEYELLKEKTQAAVPINWDEEDQVLIFS